MVAARIQTIDPFRTGPATEIVTGSNVRKLPGDWSLNGDLLYVMNDDGRGVVWAVPVAGGREPVRLAELQSLWAFGRFSPDARWFSYTDERGGVPQVFVESNPPGKGPRPKGLFTFRAMNNAYTTARYDVTGDGQRFLILTPLESTPSEPMSVVQNWTNGFKP
ncbi:MAG: hypothetical protein SGI92_23835 [Bryobacteraceae bacterium]|nr:hypothetical protein [Bryobacteraceae bacterium]